MKAFIEQANLHHPAIKFTTEISDTETVRYTVVYKAQDSRKTLSLMQKHILNKRKPSSAHTKEEFVKGEDLIILRKNASETTFEENNSNFKKRLMDISYPQTLIENLLPEIKFT